MRVPTAIRVGRYVPQKGYYRVEVSASEVAAFNRKWPGSRIKGACWFEFDLRNGDLVDMKCIGGSYHGMPVEVGAEGSALAEDAQLHAIKKLKLDPKSQGFRIHNGSWSR